jgi:hypothetical protein
MKRSFIRRTALASMTAATVLATGCADMQATMNQAAASINDMGKSITNSGPVSGGVGKGSTSLTQTKLMGVLRKTISADGSAPEWPKVAIVNLSIPTDLIQNMRFKFKRDDCVTFDAVVWYDEKRNEKINDVSLCAPDLPKQSNTFVTVWKSFSINGKTSGQVRTDGPTPPYSKLPSDATMDRFTSHNNGLIFIGSMLTMMGFDPNFTPDTRRFWVKNMREI